MKSLLVAVILAVPVLAHSAQAGTLHVPSQYPTIQAAVDVAVPGDVIVVAAGIYDDNTNQSSPTDTTRCVVRMKSGITIRGAGMGETIIDALSRGRGIYCEEVVDATIEHLTVRGACTPSYGAGIFCYNGSSPVLNELEITDNDDAALLIMNSSSPHVINCMVTGNHSKQGGGISIENESSPVFSNTTITGNNAPVGGGAFIRNNCNVLFEYCTISTNQLDSPNASGGGLAIVNANVTLRHCAVENNSGTGSGGGLAILDYANLTAENTRIVGNSTSDHYGSGGGIYLEFANATLTECLIADNTTSGIGAEGAGIYAIFAFQLDLTQCTIAGNLGEDSSVVGGGITAFWANPAISKCIIALNSGRGLHCLDEAVPVVSCTNIFGNPGGDEICGTDAGGNFILDPLFCDVGAGDYRLQDASPCAPGQHPDGAGVCDGDRLGSEPVGCAPVSVEEPIEASRDRVLWSEPNPGIGGTAVHFTLRNPAVVRLTVHDVTGRVVRTLTEGTAGVGLHRVAWDGRDDTGSQVPAGVYFGRLTMGGSLAGTHRLVLVR